MAKMNPKQLVAEYHAKVLATGNFDLIDQYIAPNLILHTPYLSYPLEGNDEFREFITAVFSAITNLKATTNTIIAEGNWVAVRWTIEGVSVNDFMKVPAGGDERVICVMTHYLVHKGKIIEAWAVDSSMWPRVFDF